MAMYSVDSVLFLCCNIVAKCLSVENVLQDFAYSCNSELKSVKHELSNLETANSELNNLRILGQPAVRFCPQAPPLGGAGDEANP